MHSKHKISPARFRHLAEVMNIAAKSADWQALTHYDLQLRELLRNHKSCLKDSTFNAEIQRVKAIHAAAFALLQTATNELEQEMNTVNDQQERAMAYQLAMTMELTQ